MKFHRRFIQLIKFTLILAFIFGFMVTAAIVYPFVRDPWKYKRIATRLETFFSRLGLSVMNIQVDIEEWDQKNNSNALFVCNHLSYLDILVLTQAFSSCFVTSTEIRDTPFLGTICKLAGCVFVNRKNKDNIHNEIYEISEALRQGLNVMIFPEATSTNGEEVLRFRRPLYTAAVDSGRPIQPVCLNYTTINGEGLSTQNRDHVFWYGDMEFIPHLWKLMSCREINVTASLLAPLNVTPQSNILELAEESHQRVKSRFVPCPVPL